MTNYHIDIQIVNFLEYANNQEWNYIFNRYPYNTLYFILGGDGFVKIGEKATPLEVGHLYLIPANTQFMCWCTSHIHKLYVDVYCEIVPGYDVLSPKNEVKFTPYPVEKILTLISEGQKNSIKGNLYIKGEISKVLAGFIDEDFVLSDMEILRFKPLLDDIEHHLSAQIKVGDIAKKYNYNPSVLSRRFKSVFHVSLKSKIEQLLLNKIKQELILTDKTVKEIATQYDFCDQYYMSGFFKKHEGCSPTQYRKNNGMK